MIEIHSTDKMPSRMVCVAAEVCRGRESSDAALHIIKSNLARLLATKRCFEVLYNEIGRME